MKDESTWSLSKSMLIPIGIAIAFICWGLIVYYSVGDKVFTQWSPGIVEDVPGQSPHSTITLGRDPRPEPDRIREGILRQHVDSNPNQPGTIEDESNGTP